MKLITMIDELLRNRSMLYQEAREGTKLIPLCGRLLLLFCLTAAIYGAVMGSFRSIHPTFFFSDFEINYKEGESFRGKVAGITPQQNAVYTRTKLILGSTANTIRFNVTNPTDPYTITNVSTEKGYTKISLAKGSRFTRKQCLDDALARCLENTTPFPVDLTHLRYRALYSQFSLWHAASLHAVDDADALCPGRYRSDAAGFCADFYAFHGGHQQLSFMKLLHVLVFIIAGVFGVRILGEGLKSMNSTADAEQENAQKGNARMVLLSWLLLYCLVGSQLAWTLKPFLGTPYLPATPPFRMEQGNIFVSTVESMRGIKPAE